MRQLFLDFVKQQISMQLVPITVQPMNLLKLPEYIEHIDELRPVAKKQELIIRDYNEEAKQLISRVTRFIYQQIESQLMPKQELKQIVTEFTKNEFKFTPFIHDLRVEQFEEAFLKISKLLVDQSYRLLEGAILELMQNAVECSQFHEYLTKQVEQSMSVLTLEMKDFCGIESDDLYMDIKQLMHKLIQSLHYFVHKASFDCNAMMESLNELFGKYASLANMRTYQVLQTEMSLKIISHIHSLLKQYCFFRPEFLEYEDEFVKAVIRYYYDYSTAQLPVYCMSTKTKSFQDSMVYAAELIQNAQSKSSDSKENYTKYKQWLEAKRQAQKQLNKGATGTAGASIGAGIGSLIIDSSDPTIPWDEKLKRAGYTTLTTGLVGASFRIPVIGVIIHQLVFAYIIKKTAANQVISNDQKAKTFAHIGAQSTVGIGSAVIGQMLIPIPVLGAIIGGTIGGIAIGFYDKVVVSKTKPTIAKMLSQLESRICPDGLLLFNDNVFELMKINQKHFYNLKPKELGDSQWLTITTVYLINELHFVVTLLADKQIEAYTAKIETEPKKAEKYSKKVKEIESEVELMDAMNVKWERCRIYIQENKIETLPIAEQVGEFIGGMIANFKMQ